MCVLHTKMVMYALLIFNFAWTVFVVFGERSELPFLKFEKKGDIEIISILKPQYHRKVIINVLRAVELVRNDGQTLELYGLGEHYVSVSIKEEILNISSTIWKAECIYNLVTTDCLIRNWTDIIPDNCGAYLVQKPLELLVGPTDYLAKSEAILATIEILRMADEGYFITRSEPFRPIMTINVHNESIIFERRNSSQIRIFSTFHGKQMEEVRILPELNLVLVENSYGRMSVPGLKNVSIVNYVTNEKVEADLQDGHASMKIGRVEMKFDFQGRVSCNYEPTSEVRGRLISNQSQTLLLFENGNVTTASTHPKIVNYEGNSKHMRFGDLSITINKVSPTIEETVFSATQLYQYQNLEIYCDIGSAALINEKMKLWGLLNSKWSTTLVRISERKQTKAYAGGNMGYVSVLSSTYTIFSHLIKIEVSDIIRVLS